MSETPNIGLYLEEDTKTKFKEWRRKMNGEDNSNMVIIDTEFGKRAVKSVQVTGTLLASAWSGVDAPFTQEISVDGLGVTQNGTIAVSQSATFEQRQMAREAMLALAGQSEGKLIVVADGEMPDIDIPFVVTLLG